MNKVKELFCALAVAGLSAAVPASAVTIINSENGVLFHSFDGPPAGFYQRVIFETDDPLDNFGYPDATYSNDIDYLYYDSLEEDGTAINNRPNEIICDPLGCGAPAELAKMSGTSKRFIIQTFAGYNNCDPPGPDGQECAIFPRYPGGGVTFYAPFLSRTGSGRLIIGDPTAVPEPGTWAMMIAGFFVVGAGLRRRVRRIA